MRNRVPVFFVADHPTYTPLGLGLIQAYAEQYRDGELNHFYRFMPLLIAEPERAIKVGRAFGPGVWLFANYVWSVDRSMQISAAIKCWDPRNITIHGGPSTPKYPDACEAFLRNHQHVDIAVRGEGEVVTADLLELFASHWGAPERRLEALRQVAGISFLDQQQLVRTAERPRIDKVERLPSPYLSGVFDKFPEQLYAAVLETNRGCPYSCTFCDWGSLIQQKIKLFDVERVKAEIEWICGHRVPVLFMADSNFGILERDVAIAEHIAAAKQHHGFPREVIVSYAKNATPRLAQIVKIFNRAAITSQAVISIQTTDPKTLKAVDRSNIKTERYVELMEIFRREGLPISTDLMIGLPGSTYQSFKRDLQRFFDDNIPVKAYRTVLLPNSPMADPQYIARHQIEIDEKNRVVATASFDRHQLKDMDLLYNLYFSANSVSYLRYLLHYLQWDHGILATDYLETLLRRLKKRPGSFATIELSADRTSVSFNMAKGDWSLLYREIGSFTAEHFGLERDSAFETALRVNQAVMPNPGVTYPRKVALDHDYVAYYMDHTNQSADLRGAAPLLQYSPAEMTIRDPHDLSGSGFERDQYDIHQVFWELDSPLKRVTSPVPNYLGNETTIDGSPKGSVRTITPSF